MAPFYHLRSVLFPDLPVTEARPSPLSDCLPVTVVSFHLNSRGREYERPSWEGRGRGCPVPAPGHKMGPAPALRPPAAGLWGLASPLQAWAQLPFGNAGEVRGRGSGAGRAVRAVQVAQRALGSWL